MPLAVVYAIAHNVSNLDQGLELDPEPVMDGSTQVQPRFTSSLTRT